MTEHTQSELSLTLSPTVEIPKANPGKTPSLNPRRFTNNQNLPQTSDNNQIDVD